MSGSRLKRQRNLGVRAEDGSVIAFPRLDSAKSRALTYTMASCSGLRRRSHGSLTCRLMTSLKSCHGRLASLTHSASQCACRFGGVVFMIGTKAHFDGSLGREAARERIIKELARREFGAGD